MKQENGTLIAGMAQSARAFVAEQERRRQQKEAAAANGRLSLYESYRSRTADVIQSLADVIKKLPGFSLVIDENIPGEARATPPMNTCHPDEAVVCDDVLGILDGHTDLYDSYNYDGYFRKRASSDPNVHMEAYVRARLVHNSDQLSLTFTWESAPWTKDADRKFSLSEIRVCDQNGSDRGWHYWGDGHYFKQPEKREKLGKLIAQWLLAADPENSARTAGILKKADSARNPDISI